MGKGREREREREREGKEGSRAEKDDATKEREGRKLSSSCPQPRFLTSSSDLHSLLIEITLRLLQGSRSEWRWMGRPSGSAEDGFGLGVKEESSNKDEEKRTKN